MTTINVKRVYEDASEHDGMRILVDRIWPRGLSKEKANIDKWVKEIAPSLELRRWYNHRPEKWRDFKSMYFKELSDREVFVKELCDESKKGNITLVFSSKETELNNATALKEYLELQCSKNA